VIRLRHRGFASILAASTGLSFVTGCATAPSVDTPATAPHALTDTQVASHSDAQPPAHRRWEDATRRRVDGLVEVAQQLAAAGDSAGATDRLDRALCLVLSTPDGYDERPAWLDFVADLLTETEAIEDRLAPPVDGGSQLEVVDLPSLEPADVAEPIPDVGTGGLPPSDFPLVRNATVERFLEAFTRPGEYRSRIGRGLARSGPYVPMIRDQLEKAGVPRDLAWLPLIESSFSLTATSRARAHGPWQFIASTGRHYGLRIDAVVDERRDPVRSTQAAAAYLADLDAQFDDWYLALAAYNSGAGNVRRAIRRTGSRDFWTLRNHLPRETRDYVPAFIASVIVASRPTAWDFDAPTLEPWTLEAVPVPDALDLEVLAARLQLDIDDLRRINPALKRDLTPAARTTTIWLPSGVGPRASELLAELPHSDWAPRILYTVHPGDTLSVIASHHGSSVSAIRAANGLSGSLIHPGETLLVPRPGVEISATIRIARRSSSEGIYVVQSSDTLWDIARSFGVDIENLCAANGLGRDQVIHPGQRLRIPDDRTRG
jgi:membrane-bound lytic murein transglycosylase D